MFFRTSSKYCQYINICQMKPYEEYIKLLGVSPQNLPLFTRKSRGNHDVNSNRLLMGEDSSMKGGQRAHSKTGGLIMKGGRKMPKTAKNWAVCGTFKRLCGTHRPPSRAGTSGIWSSTASLPRHPARVLFWQQHIGKTGLQASANRRTKRKERREKRVGVYL